MQRIVAEHIASRPHRVAHGNGLLGHLDRHSGLTCELVERRGETTAGRVAEATHRRRGGKHIGYQMVEGSSVAFHIGGKRERLAAAHDRDTVIPKRPRDKHNIPRLTRSAAEVDSGCHDAHTARIDKHAVAMPPVDYLRIAGDQLDASLFRGFGHACADAAQIIHRITLFEHEPTAQIERASATRGDVVNRPADGKATDVSAGKEMGRHHETISRERKATAALELRDLQHGSIITTPQFVARIRFEKHFVYDALHHRAATSVAEKHRLLHSAPSFHE